VVSARGLLALGYEAPEAPLEAFLTLPGLGDGAQLWDATAWGEPAAWALRGEVARVEIAAGEPLEAIREQAAALLGPGGEEVGPLRWFGGVSFSVQPRHPGPWGAFARASFTLPRWSYERRPRGGARLWLTTRETGDRAALDAEARRVLDALAGAALAPPEPRRLAARMVDDEASGDGYLALVARALDAIASGRFEKLVPARRVELSGAFDVAAVLGKLRALQPGAACFCVARGGASFLGATPERLVAVEGGVVRSEAVAGSVARQGDDEAARARLLASEKDRREHAAVVDGIERALAARCDGVEVAPQAAVRVLRQILHLVTPVRARLRPGGHVLDVVEALHPTPAVGGLPAAGASDWLDAEEPVGRGWYASPVGWFDGNGNGQFAVAIRSALVDGERAWAYAGAGVVRGSEPAAELAETRVKLGVMREALGVS
jgi:isochorismate synthase